MEYSNQDIKPKDIPSTAIIQTNKKSVPTSPRRKNMQVEDKQNAGSKTQEKLQYASNMSSKVELKSRQKDVIKQQEKKLLQIGQQNLKAFERIQKFNNQHFDSGEKQTGGASMPDKTVEAIKISGDKKYNKPKIEDFEVKEMVGVGHFGKVYKAINKAEADRPCVLKVLEKESVGQMKHAEHIVQEHDVLRYIESRNI